MQEIGKIATTYKNGDKELNINVIPNNMEKYITFILDDLVFIDSFQFMSSEVKYTSQVFQGDELKLIKEKGVYPYDYMDCFKKF